MVLSGRNIIFFIFFGLMMYSTGAVVAQNPADSLAGYSYLELDDLIYENRRDSSKMTLYLNYYLQKAQEEKNSGRIAIYYRSFVFYQKEEDRLPFIDSALHYAYQTHDKALIGSVYLTKATVYHNIKDYQNTLDHYLKAHDYIRQTDDTYNKYRVKNHIGAIKNYLGYYEEAGELFEECVAYFGRDESRYNMQRGYVSSLMGLAWSYTKAGRIAESEQLLAAALASAEKVGFSELDVHYLVFKAGINDYFLGNYDSAIYKIEQTLPFLYENEDFAWASIGEFYIGKSHWHKGDSEQAIAIFTKIDELFTSKSYTHPDLREGYELLINHYKAQDDKEKQIRWIEQLVRVDSVFNQSHRHLLNRIHKEYTTKDLLDAKRELEIALYLQKNKTTWLVTVAVIVLLLAFVGMDYRQRKTKKIAQELIRKIKASQAQPHLVGLATATVKKTAKPPAQMKDEVVEQLLDKLSRFEQKQRFLKPDITLEKLANSFGTNTSYLSTVINTYKKQRFPEYLNSLRIDYMVDEMVKNTDSVLFKYSIDSLAVQLGYGSASAFSRAFQKHTGVKPSTFIKEVRHHEMALEPQLS